ncbi:ABC-type sugar transport system ATPase subunit [Leucobacter exalbidus]|uniref:ABC-type sugar transport system ATPase subunit n=1 Tax=Leucobacter exalbidus TaxID=662960 RepID=A0A940T6N9_9MICO|nr:ABC-type sugar transport system ATPase subunit [Leucobacter exalbidus]
MDIQPSEMGLVARVAHLSKFYGGGAGAQQVTALNDVSIGIKRGQFTAIMGPSGSGKSTLMHVMAGLDTATEGRVWLGDDEITSLGDAALTKLRRRRIGFVFQAFNLVPTLDVLGNIRLPFELDGRKPTGAEQARIDALLARSASPSAPGTAPTSSRAASSSASPSRAPSPPSPMSSSLTSPRVPSTHAPAARCCRCCARQSPTLARASPW